MLWIGLTGGIATGKSSVSRILKSSGYSVVDADQLAREVVSRGTPGYGEVIAEFGNDAITPSGELNRKRIGEVVFRDRSKLSRLEAIIHPRVRELAEKKKHELAQKGEKMAFYDVPLLFEKNMKPLFDRVVVVCCSPDVQLQRLMVRDGLSLEDAQRRIAAQLPILEKVKQADEVIENNGSLEDLQQRVQVLLKNLE